MYDDAVRFISIGHVVYHGMILMFHENTLGACHVTFTIVDPDRAFVCVSYTDMVYIPG